MNIFYNTLRNLKNISWILIAKILGAIGLIILIASLLWIIFDYNYFGWFLRINSKTASELGGFISGFVGIFWTAAGVILIYATFNKQRELNDKQQFETAFFNLLSTYHNLVQNTSDNIDKNNDGNKQDFNGREFISAVLNEIKSGLSSTSFKIHLSRNTSIPEIKQFHKTLGKTEKNMEMLPKPEFEIDDMISKFESTDVSKEFIIAQYDYFYNKHQAKLGHIFRFLYNIFKFTIHERNRYNDQKRYIDLIQAQLSSDELALLFYNALSKNAKSSEGELRFYNWLENFNFFENIDKNSLLKKGHANFYPKTRFKFLDNNDDLQ